MVAHEEIQVDLDHSFEFEFFDKTGQLIPTSATYNVKDNGGLVKQTGTATIDANGKVTVDYLAANNTTVDINYKVELTYIVGGITSKYNTLFDIVKHPINNQITDKDIFTHLGDLREKQYTRNGKTSINGSVSTFIDNFLTTDNRDWLGGSGEILLKEGAHRFSVTNYDDATGTITFSPSAPDSIPVKTNYIMRESYQSIIDEAFYIVHGAVRRKVSIASGYINNNVLNKLVVYKAIEIISIARVEVVGDKWEFRATKFKELYETELAGLSSAYDTNMDGDIDDWEDEDRPTSFTVARSDLLGRI